MPEGWDPGPSDQPLPPQNGQVVNPFVKGILDIRWDDPALLAGNSLYTVVGVNVYRSDASDRGPYFRLNSIPVGGGFYRDLTDMIPIHREVIPWDSGWVSRGDAPNVRRWTLRTSKPIVKAVFQPPYSRATPANSPADVTVYVNNVIVPVEAVFGPTGDVTLVNTGDIDVARQRIDAPTLPTETSTVEVSYFAAQNVVRAGLELQTYYRLTTVVIDPTTPSGYRESGLGYCPPIISGQTEALDYIWREAVRRNQWIVQQGGERAKVFIRRTAGVPCSHGMDPRTIEFGGQPSIRCHICFVPGTLVRTETGYRPIEKVKVGDRVLSSDGLYHNVTKVFETPYEGDLVSLTSTVSTVPILVTPEHPFKTLRGAHKRKGGCGPKCDRFIERGDGNAWRGSVTLLPSGRWWARVQIGESRGKGRKALGTFTTREEAQRAIAEYQQNSHEPGHILVWEDAVNLRAKDWLVGKAPVEEQDLQIVSIPADVQKNTSLGTVRLGPSSFTVDEDFLWMVGLYLAEGSSGSRTICFSLHADETVFQERLMRYFSFLGYNPSIRVDDRSEGSGAVVSVNSTTLAEWFPVWLGRGCANKHIPEELMKLPVAKTWALIQGIHDGDGSKSNREITQTSEILALQLAELLHRVGEQPLIRQQRSNILTSKGNVRKLAYCVSWAESTTPRINRKGRWAFGRELLARIRKVGRQAYSGLVYNLEVEGDHTYVVQGVLTHNCFGTGFVGGYDGPFDVLIAPDDAERKISQTMTGRRREHSQEVWMGPSPVVTMRDFIVKQTNERYAIGPVRRPTNRGVYLQQHFQTGALDEADIRYAVPIDGVEKYAWPQNRWAIVQTPTSFVDGYPPTPQQRQINGLTPTADPWPLNPTAEAPMGTSNGSSPPELEKRGRTTVWSNINR